MPTLKRIATTLMFALPLTALVGQAETVSTAKREVLVESDHSWDGTKYDAYPTGTTQLTTIKLTIPAHTALPWHTHPFPNACYLLSGTLTIHDKETGKKATYHEGQAFPESVNRIHRGETGDKPAVLLITYAGVAGKPTSVPAKGELPEY